MLTWFSELLIAPANHQNLAVYSVLHSNRNQSVVYLARQRQLLKHKATPCSVPPPRTPAEVCSLILLRLHLNRRVTASLALLQQQPHPSRPVACLAEASLEVREQITSKTRHMRHSKGAAYLGAKQASNRNQVSLDLQTIRNRGVDYSGPLGRRRIKQYNLKVIAYLVQLVRRINQLRYCKLVGQISGSYR